MTESEWLACADPQPMLEFLRGKASDRKLRLFAVACCRRIWHLINAPEGQMAVEVSERFADDEISLKELALAASNAMRYVDECYRLDRPDGGAYAAYSAASAYERDDFGNFGDTACCDIYGVDAAAYACRNAIQADEGNSDRVAQSNLLREVCGNPFRPIHLNPAWLTWNEGTVVMLAQSIYDDRAFDRLPILADALEEAGCVNPEFLAHCRQSGEHVRGCWVVDAILGKD